MSAEPTTRQLRKRLGPIFGDIMQERFRQIRLHGDLDVQQLQAWGDRNAILAEEFGESAKETVTLIFRYSGASLDALRDELVHVAAVSVATIEQIDLYKAKERNPK